MSANSAIEWTDHTFNPWWGCVKVSPGCQHCYAEALSARYMPDHSVWGKHAPRRVFGEKHWAEPLKWNRKAVADGARRRVFCASMADVFERHGNRDINAALDGERARLWSLIEQTTEGLDWLLLTKRPENILDMIPARWQGQLLDNIWIGTSAENQRRANERIPILARVPAAVRFLSCEPLLGPIGLFGDVECPGPAMQMHGYSYDTDYGTEWDASPEVLIDWVIVGGESGVDARPIKPEWVRALRDECKEWGVAFFFKQWGGRVAKSGGRLLDGVEWSEFPVAFDIMTTPGATP